MTWDLSFEVAAPTKIKATELADRTLHYFRRLLNLSDTFEPHLLLKQSSDCEGGWSKVDQLSPDEHSLYCLQWRLPDFDMVLIHFYSNSVFSPNEDPQIHRFVASDIKGKVTVKHVMALCLIMAAADMLGAVAIEDDSAKIFSGRKDCMFHVEEVMRLALTERSTVIEAVNHFWLKLPVVT